MMHFKDNRLKPLPDVLAVKVFLTLPEMLTSASDVVVPHTPNSVPELTNAVVSDAMPLSLNEPVATLDLESTSNLPSDDKFSDSFQALLNIIQPSQLNVPPISFATSELATMTTENGEVVSLSPRVLQFMTTAPFQIEHATALAAATAAELEVITSYEHKNKARPTALASLDFSFTELLGGNVRIYPINSIHINTINS